MNLNVNQQRERELRGPQLKFTWEIQFAAAAPNKAHANWVLRAA